MEFRGNRWAMFGAATVALLLAGPTVHAGDYSVDPTSPEVPFTYGVGDVVNDDGAGVHLTATQLGLDPNDNVDAVSYGDDQVEPGGIENLVGFDFSVDRTTVGGGGPISTQATGNGAAGDKFRILSFRNGRTVGPQLFSDSTNHGLTARTSGTTESDLDALALLAGTRLPVFFSVDRAGSAALPTMGPSDIMYVREPGVTVPTVFATAAQLGLGPNDNIDALCIMDRGRRGELDSRDLVHISLDRSSPTRATFFNNGTDGVIGIWPQPARVVFQPSQLGLTISGADELNAMTARDPVDAGGPGARGRIFDYIRVIQSDPVLFAAFALLLSDSKFVRAFADRSPGVGIRVVSLRERAPGAPPTVRAKGGKTPKTRVLQLSSSAADGFGFIALPHIAERVISVRGTTSTPSLDGLRLGQTNWGCEIDIDAEPGTIPARFLYVGITPLASGFRVFVNDSRTNVGTPQDFPAATEIEFSMVLAEGFGADVIARDPGGAWRSVFRDPTYDVGTLLTAGFGASRIDVGAEVRFYDVELLGNLFPDVGDYALALQSGAVALDRAGRDLENAADAPSPDDIGGAIANLREFIDLAYGSEAAGKSKPTTFANGLIEQTRDATLGPLPDDVSSKKTAKSVQKAAKSALRAVKQLERGKPNLKKARKLIAKALAALDDARDLLTFGKKLR